VPRGNSGFTLVEVLVALLVFTVGLLGVAQLQWGAQRASTASFQRTQAQVQAIDMSERMWLDLSNPLAQEAAWQATHGGSFPGWQGSVEATATDPELYRIRIEWDDPSPREPRFDHFVRLPRVAP